MGYTTDFEGKLLLSKLLTTQQFKFLELFSQVRHIRRNTSKLMELYHGKGGYPGRTGTPDQIYGNEGEYFVANDKQDASVINYNCPPGGDGYGVINDRQTAGITPPGLYCQWEVIDDDGTQFLQWDGGEKFYNYVEWLKYLIHHFFNPWGVLLNGEIIWQGEDSGDRGKIKVVNNVVTECTGRVEYDEPTGTKLLDAPQDDYIEFEEIK